MRLKSVRKLIQKIYKWESWHYHIKYIPIAPVWLWYCIKARSFWFFTAANPTITFGGFEGEGKKEIYDQLPQSSYPSSVLIDPGIPFREVVRSMESGGLQFPLVVKPDIGAMGYLFRRITSERQLARYHEFMDVAYLLQEWVDYRVELSVFYYRLPDARCGVISGMLMKEMPVVIGDGKSTIEELIGNDETLKLNFENIILRHKSKIQTVLPAGKSFILSHASNRSQGGKLVNLDHEIDEKLSAVFDKISHHSRHFYYGRYDVKCESLDALREGKNFSILEYNGSGAGIQHVYGNNLSLWRACYTIVKHWEKLYQISRYNRKKKNIAYWKYAEGKKFLSRAMLHLKKLKTMDASFPV